MDIGHAKTSYDCDRRFPRSPLVPQRHSDDGRALESAGVLDCPVWLVVHDVGVADHIERAVGDRAGGRIVEFRMMMRLQHGQPVMRVPLSASAIRTTRPGFGVFWMPTKPGAG